MKKIGTLILVLGLVLGFSCCKAEVDNAELTGITVTPPSKLTYNVGEDLNTEGMVVTATYSNGTTVDVTKDVTTSGFDSSVATESQTITVTYGGKTATFTVKIIAIEVTKIEITTQPTKKEYYTGATALDLTGMVVTATYNNGTTADVTKDVTTSGFDSSKVVESQTITVSYGGKSATFTIKILAKLSKIEITTEPTKKDYHIGDTLDLTDMVVTANYNDGSTKTLASNEYTVTGFDSTAYVNDKEITVTYNEKTATFTINVVFNWYETPEQLSAGTPGTYGSEGTYVLFGVWPQDVVPEADVAGLALDENATTTIERGSFKFVKGTDGNYYVKCAENAYDSSYKYNKDDSDVGQGGTTYRWFKVMPIKWRVVDTKYDVDGDTGTATGKLLVAESILTANVPYYESTSNRTISNSTVYVNNYMHSQIRAYLNGISYNAEDPENNNKWYDNANSKGKGFLQTAFTVDAADKILITRVDNSEDSTTNYDTQNGTITKATEYVCDPTDDKIFLLSEYEVTKYSKSTEAYYVGNSRIRVTTDFAKANYASQRTTNGYGGLWWLRSPSYSDSNYARFVDYDGNADCYDYVYDTEIGVVPALTISF